MSWSTLATMRFCSSSDGKGFCSNSVHFNIHHLNLRLSTPYQSAQQGEPGERREAAESQVIF